MRLSGSNTALKNIEVTSRDRQATQRARDTIQASNVELQRRTFDIQRETGKATNAADAEQGVANGTSTALLTAAGLCMLIPPPAGPIASAICAAIAVAIIIYEALHQKSERDEIADDNHVANDLKVTTDANQAHIKQLDDRVKNADEDVRAYVQQQIENIRREYDAHHRPE
jgi:hypothetical protein